jgi:hypothetical protein
VTGKVTSGFESLYKGQIAFGRKPKFVSLTFSLFIKLTGQVLLI